MLTTNRAPAVLVSLQPINTKYNRDADTISRSSIRWKWTFRRWRSATTTPWCSTSCLTTRNSVPWSTVRAATTPTATSPPAPTLVKCPLPHEKRRRGAHLLSLSRPYKARIHCDKTATAKSTSIDCFSVIWRRSVQKSLRQDKTVKQGQ